MSKKREKNNSVLEQFRFFFCAKNKDICTKKSVMKFWEIQENKIVLNKKMHKKNYKFLGNFGKKFFFLMHKKKCNDFLGNLGKKFFFCAKKKTEKQNVMNF